MVLGIDIDGVILDYENVLANEAEKYDLSIDGKGIINEKAFSPLDQYEWNKEEKSGFTNQFVEFTYRTPLVSNSKESIDLLKSKGFKIILISARGSINPKTKTAVLDMLKKYEINYDEIYLGIKDKENICKDLNVSYMIDDNPNICEQLSSKGIPVIYFKQSKFVLDENENMKVCTSWDEVRDYLLEQ